MLRNNYLFSREIKISTWKAKMITTFNPEKCHLANFTENLPLLILVNIRGLMFHYPSDIILSYLNHHGYPSSKYFFDPDKRRKVLDFLDRERIDISQKVFSPFKFNRLLEFLGKEFPRK